VIHKDIAVVKETLESHGLDSLFSELFEMRVDISGRQRIRIMRLR